MEILVTNMILPKMKRKFVSINGEQYLKNKYVKNTENNMKSVKIFSVNFWFPLIKKNNTK